MGEAFKNLGVDFASLIAQAINFGLLFLILWYFLYKPIIKMLDARTKKIEVSLKQAEDIQKEYDEIEKHKGILVAKAKESADEIIDAAKIEAKEIEKTASFEAHVKARAIISEGELEATKHKNTIVEEARNEVAKLVESSLTSLLKNDSKKYDDALINEALAGFIEKD